MIARQHSKHNKELDATIKPSEYAPDTLDTMDRDLLLCIREHPGLSIRGVYRCYCEQTGHRFGEQQVRYRIRTLEKAGFIRTERVVNHWAERRCFLDL